MKFPSRYFVAAALMAAPVSLSAQTAQPAPQQQGQHARDGQRGELRGQRGPGGSPVRRLLAQRERLNLTDAQVQRLEAIDRDLQARNAPLQQQMAGLFPERAQRAEGARPRGERQVRPDGAQRGERRPRGGDRQQPTEAQRQQMQQRRQQAQPILEQLRQNNETALTQARGVLTAEQQRQVQQLLERRRGERGERGQRGERGERGGERRGGAGQSR